MKLRKINRARLASLSALGAGALGVATQNAEASSIVYTPLNGEVGFYSGAKSIFTFSTFKAPVIPGLSLYFRRSALLTSTNASRLATGKVDMVGVLGGLGFRVTPAASGSKWSYGVGGLAFSQALGQRTAGGSTLHFGNPNGTFYKLFAFVTPSSSIDFGWVKLNESLSSTSGPDVKIEGIAYDTSGALIAAGDTGQAPTPEPSTAALAGLSALALGATGLRRWRKVRKPAA